MVSLLGGYQISSKASIIMTAMVIGVQLAILLYFRPYDDAIHNVSIILNQSSVLFLSIILYQRNEKAAIGQQYL